MWKSTLWRGCHGNWIEWRVRTNFAALCKERSPNTSVLNDGSGHSGFLRNILKLSNKDKLSKANLGSIKVFWVLTHRAFRGTGAPSRDSPLPGSQEPPRACRRTYQVAFLLPHAGGADHVILFPSPVSKATEKIVGEKPTDGVSNDVDVDGLVSSKPNTWGTQTGSSLQFIPAARK